MEIIRSLLASRRKPTSQVQLDLKNELELLAAEIAGYRDRWRGTERLAEERLLMLLGVVAPALAATAVISTRPVTSGGSLSSDEGLALMWLAVAVVAEGLFIRLMHARLSIYRSIVCLNRLRAAVVSLLPDSTSRTALADVLELDRTPPRPFSVLSLPTASALTASLAVATSLALNPWHPPGRSPIWVITAALPSAIFGGDLLWFRRRARRFAMALSMPR